MDKAKIKVIIREIFLFFALPAAAFIAVVGFIFASFILDSLIRYLTGNFGSSEWITQLALVMDRALFYPYLFVYPIFVLARIMYREKRKETLLKSGLQEADVKPSDPEKARRRKRAIIREGIIFLVFLIFGLSPFLGVYQIFGISLTLATQIGMWGFLVTILYILYIVIRYIIIGVFIRGIIWIVRKLMKK